MLKTLLHSLQTTKLIDFLKQTNSTTKTRKKMANLHQDFGLIQIKLAYMSQGWPSPQLKQQSSAQKFAIRSVKIWQIQPPTAYKLDTCSSTYSAWGQLQTMLLKYKDKWMLSGRYCRISWLNKLDLYLVQVYYIIIQIYLIQVTNMSATLSDSDNIQTSHKLYRFYTDFKARPLRTLQLAIRDEQLKQHETILKYQSNFKKTGFRIFRDMLIACMLAKLATSYFHHRRSLALSAPKNIYSSLLKYAVFPAFCTYLLQRNRYLDMMSTVEDLKDDQIQQRYSIILNNKAKNNIKQ